MKRNTALLILAVGMVGLGLYLSSQGKAKGAPRTNEDGLDPNPYNWWQGQGGTDPDTAFAPF